MSKYREATGYENEKLCVSVFDERRAFRLTKRAVRLGSPTKQALTDVRVVKEP